MKICGEVKLLEKPEGGGFYVSETRYTDGTSDRRWYKSRMVFPRIEVGGTTLKRAFVANDTLGGEIAENIGPGDRVCFFVFGHLLRKKCIIGVKTESGHWYRMPGKGLFGGLLWYGVFSPFFVALVGGIVGMMVGMVGGQKGVAMGLLLGVLYGVGISWLSAYRFVKAYREMQAAS
jgi:hypothetical protein